MRIICFLLLTGVHGLAAVGAKPLENAPLAFEPNRGQWQKGAAFGVRAAGFTALFRGDGIKYQLHAGERRTEVNMRWIGAAANRDIVAADQLPGTTNYYVGKDESRWITGMPTYRRLRVGAVYPGIDLVYYGTGKQLEYDLEVAPGADPGRIRLAIDGGKPTIDADGNLVLETLAGTFAQHKPVAYQNFGGKRTPVSARYVVNEDGTVKLALGRYDKRQKLVIDPTIAWAATLGSGQNGGGTATAVAVDSSGNVFVAGYTYATDFPLVNAFDNAITGACCGYYDAFVTKYSADGSTILFSTYYSGANNDYAYGLTVDGAGNAIIVGITNSADLSTKSPYQSTIKSLQDAFVAKFGPTGAMLFGTFLGGSGPDTATAVAVDSSNNILVTGYTTSTDFPTKTGSYQMVNNGNIDAFLTKFSADGSTLLFSTYIGSTGIDQSNSIALGPDGSIYIGGFTYSTAFPTVNAFQVSQPSPVGKSGFVTRFAASGASLIYSTYISGTAICQVSGLDVDSAGSAYITGTANLGFPTKNATQSVAGGGNDAFLTKLTADGSALVYSTYLGGIYNDTGSAVRVDAAGNATVVGSTSSSDFPTFAAFRPSNISNSSGGC